MCVSLKNITFHFIVYFHCAFGLTCISLLYKTLFYTTAWLSSVLQQLDLSGAPQKVDLTFASVFEHLSSTETVLRNNNVIIQKRECLFKGHKKNHFLIFCLIWPLSLNAWDVWRNLTNDWIESSLVLPDFRTSFHLYNESGPTQLTNVNSLEAGWLLRFKTIGSAECHPGSAVTNRSRLARNHVARRL